MYREGKGRRKRGKHQCVVASCVPPTGTPPTTQACALSGNQIRDPLVHCLATIQYTDDIYRTVYLTSIY